jgi:hypothetical protein
MAKKPEDGPKLSKRNWRIMVDKRTQLMFSKFFKTKDGMVEPTCCTQLNKWKQAGLMVKHIHMDKQCW